MKKPAKKILTVSSGPGLEERNEDTSNHDVDDKITVGVIDLALPCRHYWVDYKTSNSEKVSPTLEFFLRLIHSAPGIERDQVAGFFGYNNAETDYVIREADVYGYTSEKDGRLNLTIAGRNLFEKSKDGPRLYSVKKKADKVAFDLLSLAPTRRDPLAVRSLPELPIANSVASKSVSKEIQTGRLKRFFGELGLSRNRVNEEPCSLYSVDSVRADNRFQEIIPVALVAPRLQPSNVVPDLSEWRPDHEVADRLEIEREISRYVGTMKTVSRTGDGDEAYDILLQLFPNYLEKYSNRRGLNVERFWRTSSTTENSPRKNRKTVPVIGSLFTKTNSKTLGDVVDYGTRQASWRSWPKKLTYCWLAPQISTWAASSKARSANDLIKARIATAASDAVGDLNVANLCVFSGKHPFHLRDVFDYVEDLESMAIPRELELLYIPGILTAATVHAPISQNFGFPTPLGVISFDEIVLENTQKFFDQRFKNADSDRLRQFLRNAGEIGSHKPIDQP